MTKVQGKTLSTLAALALSTSILLTGCGLEPVATSPEAGGVTGQFIRIPESEMVPGVVSKSHVAPIAEATITAAEGGSIQLGRMTLTFPPGALQEDTRISMRFSDPRSLQVVLLPHGIHFQKPVTLSADLSNLLTPDARWVGVAWWNESESRWDEISRHTAGNVVSGQLWHFSEYAAFQEG